MKRVALLSFLSLFLSGCIAYYQGPNHRDIENTAFVHSSITFGELETKNLANKYELSFWLEYRYLDGKPQEYPSTRTFELTKYYSPTADSPDYQADTPVSDYQTVSDFRFKGILDYDYKTCTLRLSNKKKFNFASNKKPPKTVTLTGKYDRKERSTIYMAYTVQESDIPELIGQVFYTKTSFLVCLHNSPEYKASVR